jgi:hypothetical protein
VKIKLFFFMVLVVCFSLSSIEKPIKLTGGKFFNGMTGDFPSKNTIIFEGSVEAEGGYVLAERIELPGTKLIIVIKNFEASNFNSGKMLKIRVDDKVSECQNADFKNKDAKEFIIPGNGRYEYVLSRKKINKLEFIFSDAIITDLEISVFAE